MGWFENVGYNLRGLDRLEIAELQKKVKGINELLKDFKPEQVTELSKKLGDLSKELPDKFGNLPQKLQDLSDKFNDLPSEKIANLPEDLTGKLGDLSDKLNGLQEEVDTLAEMVGGQEQAILTCAIVSAVAAIAVTSFVAFCIYQGVKLDKEKKNDLSQDTPNGKFSNVGDTEKLNNNLQQVRA